VNRTTDTISSFTPYQDPSDGLFVSDALRQIRVLHLVSAGGVSSAMQPSLFMPLLTRLPRQRVKAQVACLSPGAVPSAVLRQNGVPTFDLALSRKRFSPTAFSELVQSTRHFRPDVIQAWGHTAQVISTLLRKRCDWKPRLVWSVADTAPLAKNPGFIDKQKLKYAVKFAPRADRIVYASESGASQHRRVGFPDGGHETVPPGVDATRFKPDFAARRKLREELKLPGEAFVVGMAAPFQVEYDHATLIRAVGELIKTNPNIALVLAGHGVQKGNAPLMALIGGGALSTRVHLLGEWSDINGLYNACDLVCSSALNDQARMNVVMAMLCGVPVVATGIGAQGELIGQHGVAIEPGSPAAFIKGINRVMQLTPEKRTYLAQGARKHALANYVYVRSLQKYLQLYYDLIGRQSLVTKDLPAPEIDASLTVPPALPTEAEMNASKRKPITVVDLADPDSLESKVAEREPDELPKWRLEQEQERAKREAELEAKVAASKTVGDVLEVFESEQVKALSSESPMTERARGVADDSEELLSPELLTVEAPLAPRVSTAPSGAKKAAAASPPTVAQPDAAKQAALKAARMAALQPIAPVAQKTSPATRPAATPVTRPPVTVAAAEHKPSELTATSSKLTDSAASSAPNATEHAAESPKPNESAGTEPFELTDLPPESPKSAESAATGWSKPNEPAGTEPFKLTDLATDSPKTAESAATESLNPNESGAIEAFKLTDLAPESPKSAAAELSKPNEPAVLAAESRPLAASAPTAEEKLDTGGTQPLETLPEGTIAGLAALKWPTIEDVSSVSSAESAATAVASAATHVAPTTADVTSSADQQQIDIGSTQPLGTLAQEIANSALAGKDFADLVSSPRVGSDLADSANAKVPSFEASKPDASVTAASKSAVSKSGGSPTQSLELPDDFLLARHDFESVSAPASPPAEEPPLATGSMTEFGELTLLATGEWQAMQRSDTKSDTEMKADATKSAKNAASSKPGTSAAASSESKPDTAKPVASADAKAAATKAATSAAARSEAKPVSTKLEKSVVASRTETTNALEPAHSGIETSAPHAKTQANAGLGAAAELSGADALSLISTPPSAADPRASEPTSQLALLADPVAEPKRAANAK